MVTVLPERPFGAGVAFVVRLLTAIQRSIVVARVGLVRSLCGGAHVTVRSVRHSVRRTMNGVRKTMNIGVDYGTRVASHVHTHG